ncbi:PKD domain-containing protein [Paraflavisolibacter sp. H34]|uniref:PKD domain-containing protein n=1 Tax=Huijunlia imazamoxiresistens TaxID=3127457 RepID=UPI00301A095C
MKKLYSLIALLFLFLPAFAAHIVGGEMTYQYLSSSGGQSRYRIVLRLFRDKDCDLTSTNCAPMPPEVAIGIYYKNNNNWVRVPNPAGGEYWQVDSSGNENLPVTGYPPCINNPPQLNYHTATYVIEVSLENKAEGYTAVYQTCCRISPLGNVRNSVNTSGGGGVGSTYACQIPGTGVLGSDHNSSPQFAKGLSIVCQGKPYSLNFSATDADGDNLVYSLCDAFDGGASINASFDTPAEPDAVSGPTYSYKPVVYSGTYTGSNPLGNTRIDPATGIITGIAPPVGRYVIAVCINEYRQGKHIGYHRKDFIVNVYDCDFAGAQLQPSYINCNNFQYTFQNENNSTQNRTYFWDAGPAGTSTQPVPTFTFPDTGAYSVKLVVNRGQTCSDSSTTQLKVYPGFTPDFTIEGICAGKLTQFTDKTVARYGEVNAWSWDFGNLNTNTDISTVKNPSYTYPSIGRYIARLIVGSSKGCVDTLPKEVEIIDKPPLSVKFADTLICNGDALQLVAYGNGNFSWTPLYNIQNSNTATPTVTPPLTTTYVVTLDHFGCLNTAPVRVRVVDTVTLKAFPDTTICATDPVQLLARGDGLRFEWRPAASLDNPAVYNPIARPPGDTRYTVTAHIGHCQATDSVRVRTVPYPIARAGADTTICYGTSAQLQGSMVASYFYWLPPSTLSNSFTLSPVAFPTDTTAYILTVRDTLGCPKPVSDTVVVRVLPKIPAFAGRDTAVIVGQPLQFQATGGDSYLWSPATALSRTDIANPLAVYDGSFDYIRYQVLVTKITQSISCVDSASVAVRIFSTHPQVFVPNAFTPNGDGLNDVFRPIAAGIARIEYFRVFNRWGEMVFSTTINGQGWDGTIRGKKQPSAVYAWLVKAIDYTGRPFFAKGTMTLIR